jgi:hypothetical protein
MTDGRSAAAMASVLANAVRTVWAPTGSEPGAKETDSTGDAEAQRRGSTRQRQSVPAGGVHCIDLTAGVGGNTIACGKRFDSVLAFEIDAARAELLRQNVGAAALEVSVSLSVALSVSLSLSLCLSLSVSLSLFLSLVLLCLISRWSSHRFAGDRHRGMR